ncbi:TPA: hypothetical protein ACH3X2_000155 [Trebouxia sp. C0005]
MSCYDDWQLLSCCGVQPFFCSRGQVSEIQDSEVAHQGRHNKIGQDMSGSNFGQHIECLVSCDCQLHTFAHSSLLCWSSSWNSHFANLLNLMHACQASQGWPVLKSGEALPKLHTGTRSRASKISCTFVDSLAILGPSGSHHLQLCLPLNQTVPDLAPQFQLHTGS